MNHRWERRLLPAALVVSLVRVGFRQNALLPAEDVDKLAWVWAVYRDHFDAAVVRSMNYERQRRALVETHQQLEVEGLTKLLSKPDLLNQGL